MTRRARRLTKRPWPAASLPPLRMLAPTLAAWAALLVGAAAARAQATYTVGDIPVDVTAQDAVAAREQAITQAQRDGLARLFHDLAPEAEPGKLPDVASLAVDRFVRSFEIASEQVGARRYVGRLNVTYQGARVREALARVDLAPAPPLPPTLVVPAVARADGLHLWFEADAWRAALAEAVSARPAAKILLPLGDVGDLAALSPAEAEARDATAAERLAQRYDAKRVVLAVLSDPAAGGTGAVELRPLAGDLAGKAVPAGQGPNPMADVAAGVVQAASGLTRAAAPPPAPVMPVRLTVAIDDLAGWLEVRQLLERAAPVRSVRVDRFGREEAALTLSVAGDAAALQQALGAQGWTIVAGADAWRLARATEEPEGSLPGAPL